MVKVILNATGYRPDLYPLIQDNPSPLFKVFNKSIIVHVIESLHQLDMSDVEVILCHMPAAIEQVLGDGSRWGINISYNLVKRPVHVAKMMKIIANRWNNVPVLIGSGDILPHFQKLDFNEGSSQFLYDKEGKWMEWCLLHSRDLSSIPSDSEFESLPALFSFSSRISSTKILSAENFTELRDSNRRALESKSSHLIPPSSTHEISPGIWLSRATALHPGAKLIPPVFIGEDCQIFERARIGPYAVVEGHCMIDKNAQIEDAVLMESSYVGIGLELRNVIACQQTVINLTKNTHIQIKDEFLLSKLSPFSPLDTLQNIGERLFACFILLLSLPLLLPLSLLYGLHKEKKLNLPTLAKKEPKETFSLYSLNLGGKEPFFVRHFRYLPSLINLVKGDIHFVGVNSVTQEDLAELSTDWQKLYLNSKTGLITLGEVEPPIDETGKVIADIYYSAHHSFIYDCKLLARWAYTKSSHAVQRLLDRLHIRKQTYRESCQIVKPIVD